MNNQQTTQGSNHRQPNSQNQQYIRKGLNGGDIISFLPTDRNYAMKPGEMELANSIFDPKTLKTPEENKGGFFQSIKLPIVAGLLFLIFSFPIIPKVTGSCIKNPIIAKSVLVLSFIIILCILQKLW